MALFEGRTLLDHIHDAIAPRVDRVVVIGRGGGIPDRPQPGLGPLGGIAGALYHAEEQGFASVLTVGCDMPRLPPELLDALLRRTPSYCSDAPILGHWQAALATPLLDRLDRDGTRSVRDWARGIGALPIPAPGPLANVNTPADLIAL